MTEVPKCPECDKLAKVAPESQKIGEFIDWLSNEKGIHLASYDVARDLEYIHIPIERLLADYFKIDLNKVEKERAAILKWIREKNLSTGGKSCLKSLKK